MINAFPHFELKKQSMEESECVCAWESIQVHYSHFTKLSSGGSCIWKRINFSSIITIVAFFFIPHDFLFCFSSEHPELSLNLLRGYNYN